MKNLLISGNTSKMDEWNVDDIINNKFSTKDNFEVLEWYRKDTWIDRRDWFDNAHMNERVKKYQNEF